MTPTGPLFWIFVLANLIAFFWLVIVGFRRHWGWGLAVFFVPFALLVFAIMYWEDAKKPFLLYLVTTIVIVYQVVNLGMMQGEALLQQAEQASQSSVFGDSSEIDQARLAAQLAMQQIESMHNAGLISDAEMAQLREEYERDMEALGGDTTDYQETASSVGSGIDTGFIEEGEIAADVVEAAPVVEEPAMTEALAGEPEAGTSVAKITPTKPKPKVKKQRIGKIDVSEATRYIGRKVIVTDKSGRTRLATLSGSSHGQLEFQRRMRTGAMTFHVHKNDITNLVLR